MVVAVVFTVLAVFMLVIVFTFIIISKIFFFRPFFQFGNPTGARKDLFKIEAVGCQQLFQRYLTARCFDHRDIRLQLLDNCADLFHLIFRHQIFFIDDERGAELNLLHKQRFDIFFSHIFVEQLIAACKLINQPFGVHNADDIIQVAVFDCFNRLRNRHRLAYAA